MWLILVFVLLFGKIHVSDARSVGIEFIGAGGCLLPSAGSFNLAAGTSFSVLF